MKKSGLLNFIPEYRKLKSSELYSGKEKQSHFFVRSNKYVSIVLMNQTNLPADLMVNYLVRDLVLEF